MIVTSSDDENPTQNRRDRVGQKTEKSRPQTTGDLSSENSPQRRLKIESEADSTTDNGIALFPESQREGNSGLEGGQLPTSPITRTRLSDSTADNKEEKLHSEPNYLHIPYNAEQDGKILKQKIGIMSLKK